MIIPHAKQIMVICFTLGFISVLATSVDAKDRNNSGRTLRECEDIINLCQGLHCHSQTRTEYQACKRQAWDKILGRKSPVFGPTGSGKKGRIRIYQ